MKIICKECGSPATHNQLTGIYHCPVCDSFATGLPKEIDNRVMIQNMERMNIIPLGRVGARGRKLNVRKE